MLYCKSKFCISRTHMLLVLSYDFLCIQQLKNQVTVYKINMPPEANVCEQLEQSRYLTAYRYTGF